MMLELFYVFCNCETTPFLTPPLLSKGAFKTKRLFVTQSRPLARMTG